MTIWVERTVNVQDWERIQNLFEEHFSGLKGPHDMILVEVEPRQSPHRPKPISGARTTMFALGSAG